MFHSVLSIWKYFKDDNKRAMVVNQHANACLFPFTHKNRFKVLRQQDIKHINRNESF